MKRLLALLAVVGLTACTPDLERLVAFLQEHDAAAEAAGAPCADLAGDLAFRGLPDHFLYVIERESHCQPTAVNRSSGALGLTQVMPMWLRNLCPLDIACTEADLLTIEANLNAAVVIYREQGPSVWSQTW